MFVHRPRLVADTAKIPFIKKRTPPYLTVSSSILTGGMHNAEELGDIFSADNTKQKISAGLAKQQL